MKEVIMIGYGGHGLVACEVLQKSGRKIVAYCDNYPKEKNLFDLPYWGVESQPENLLRLAHYDYFVAIGDNLIRREIVQNLMNTLPAPTIAIHPTAILSAHARVGKGVMLGAGCILNALATIGLGTICNTASVIEHECNIGDFCHIAPSAVLCGNVSVGDGSFIGANAVIKPNIRIGRGVIVGAGAVVLSDLPDYVTVIGNPARIR